MSKFKKMILCFIMVCLMPTGNMTTIFASDSEIHGDIRFDFTDDSDGFIVEGNSCTIDGVTDGKLMLTPVGQDPRIRNSNLSIYSSEYNYIRIRMKNNTTSKSMRIWLLGKNNSYSDRIGPISADIKSNAEADDFVEYVVPIDYSQKVGTLQDIYYTMRFDFMGACSSENVNGSCEIDSIVFSKYEKPVNDGIISKVSIGGKEVENFACDLDYYEIDLFEDEFEQVDSEKGVEITLGDAFSDSSVQYKVTNLNKKKIADINVIKGDYVRTFRFILKSKQRPVFLTIDKCESNGKTIEYSGTVQSDSGQPVSQSICIKAEDLSGAIRYINVIKSDSYGKFEGIIKIYDDEQVERYETINAIFDTMGADDPVIKVKVYMNQAQINKSIQELKAYNGGVFEFINSSEQNINVFGQLSIWIDEYNSLDSDLKKEIEDALKTRINGFNIDNIAFELNGAIVARTLNKMTETSAVSELEKLEKSSDSFKVEGKAFSDLSESSKKWIAENLINKNKNGFKDSEDLKGAVRENMLLSLVNNIHYLKLKELLLNNTDILDNSLSELKNQTKIEIADDAMEILSEKAKNTPFTEIDVLLSSIDSALKTAEDNYEDKKTGSNSNKTGGGSSGSGSGVKVELKPSAEDTPQTKPDESIFSDTEGFDWAIEAIEALYKKGIISGVGNGKFEPNRNVTREEFVKMICGGFEIDVNTDYSNTSFDDVKKSDWFYPFVEKAAELNIIKGLNANLFGSGTYISRQDAATIVSRTFDEKNKTIVNTQTLSFDDSDLIDDYAQHAVSRLCGIGIINGTDKNEFEPKRNLTRAEAAVIIYKSMNYLNN